MVTTKDMQLTLSGFNKLFERHISKCPTYQAAYDMTEDYHIKNFGKRRYSDYHSFRVVRTKFLKRK